MFELLEELERMNKLNALAREGIISTSIINAKSVFDKYQIEIKKGVKKSQCIQDLAEDYQISTRMIRRYIEWMSK